jgi:hypothetical protein
MYRVLQKEPDFFLSYNENYTILVCGFSTKFNVISKYFNYNIHFLNIVCFRWRPLLSTHSRNRFWKFCITRCSMTGEIAATSCLIFSFKSSDILGPFYSPCSWDVPTGWSRRRSDLAILQVIQFSLFVKTREVGTSRWGLALHSLQCEPLPRLAEERKSRFQHRVSATPVPEMCEASRCSGLNLLLLPSLPRLQSSRDWSAQKMLLHTKQ